MPSRYSTRIDPDRPNNAHAFAVGLVGWNRRVLELGASTGYVTKVLVEHRCRVTAVERDAEALPELRLVADEVVAGDLADPGIFDALQPEYDVVLAGDVLEHLSDPAGVLSRAVRLLKPGGFVVISTPNVAHVDVRLALLRGRWEYRPWGLLDATHVRFFTLESIRQLLMEAGLTTTELRRVRIPAFESELGIKRDSIATELLDEVLADPEAETYQFVLAAAVADGAHGIERLAEQNAELQHQIAQTLISQQALQVERDQLVLELAAAGDEIQSTREQLHRTHEELVYTQQHFQRVDGELIASRQQLSALVATEADVAELREALGAARHALRRIEESVTWQAFQRTRARLFALAGGEESIAIRGVQAALRRIGRRVTVEHAAHPARTAAAEDPSEPEPEPGPVASPGETPHETIEETAATSADQALERVPPSETACIVPWTSLVVRPDGYAAFCCDVPSILHLDGRPVNITEDPLDAIWNADELVATRTALARGERPQLCATCWKREAAGTISRRTRWNEVYAATGAALELGELPGIGAATGYRLDRPPTWFTLELGNTCNLKCRSCDPTFSSKISADPVHSAWSRQRSVHPALPTTSEHRAWVREIPRTADMIASAAAAEITVLSLLGGEPFLLKPTWDLLTALVERGVASNVIVGISTNGQWKSTRLPELAPEFRGFGVTVSIDGHGTLFEYLRHGASWETLLDTIDWLMGLDSVSIAMTPTLQNANALQFVTLLRWFDTYGFPLVYNVLHWPERLAPANLPPAIRRLAAGRLRRYLESDCPAYNADVVRGYAEVLEEDPDAFDEELFDEFMTFTNDLDESRGELLAHAEPELFELIAEAGITWTSERRYSGVPDEASR